MNSLRVVLPKLLGSALGVLALCAPFSFAYASSISIQSLSPGTTVQSGNEVSFSVVDSGFGSALTYSVSDPLSGTTVSNSDFNGSGVFTWIPTAADSGTHNLVVTATDQTGNTAAASLQITVQGPPSITIQSLSPSASVLVGQTVFFTAAASNFTNPTFSVSDSLSGSSLSQGDINSSGGFSWTPAVQDVGNHTITVTATDSSGDTANTTQSITVAPTASAYSLAVGSISPGTTIAPGQAVAISIIPTGFTAPSYTLSDSFSGTTLTNTNINASGALTWTPGQSDLGTHVITVTATDPNGSTANTSSTIVVSSTAPAAVVTSTATVASGLSANQVQAILTLLQSFNADPSVISSVSASLSGTAPTQSSSSGTTAAAGFTFSNYLYPGLQSDDVTELQTLLSKLGYFSGDATGYYGNETEQAVIAFQAAKGLDQLGVVGPATRAALNALEGSAGTSAAASGDGYVFSNFLDIDSTGQDVTELQQRLTTLGLYSGPITGYFGSLTQTAVEAFQTAHGIQAVGYVGPSTRTALNGQ